MMRHRWTRPAIVVCLSAGALAAAVPAGMREVPHSKPACARGNGDITLPPGFCATIFADLAGVTRHMAVAPNGDLYVSLENAAGAVSQIGQRRPDRGAPGILVLRDTSGDGRADVEARVSSAGATGIALRGRFLYSAPAGFILRYTIDTTRLGALRGPDTLVSGFPLGGHAAKSLAFDGQGNLYVSVGSGSNVCRPNRNVTAPDPCPELTERAGIWRYDVSRLHQHHPQDGERVATGVRNALGLFWNPEQSALYATSHGRDGLFQIWPRLFSSEKGAETPSEELFRVERGADIGWPYCYHDRQLGLKVLAPEYGGDGRTVGRCADKTAPLLGLPAHWGPNALLFYRGAMFPARYRGGAFIAFHGSWNRLPLAEQGYNVVFVPFRDGRPQGGFEVFADRFAGDTLEPILAAHRPTGFAEAPDGSLYISDDQQGRIWRVYFVARANDR